MPTLTSKKNSPKEDRFFVESIGRSYGEDCRSAYLRIRAEQGNKCSPMEALDMAIGEVHPESRKITPSFVAGFRTCSK